MRALGLILVGALAMPTTALACSCRRSAEDLHTQLKSALSEASDVYYARVYETDGLLDQGTTKLEVLEVYKGALKPGFKFATRSGGGGDCTHRFTVGETWLVYAAGSFGGIWVCSRSRPAKSDDTELRWLRTGKLPPQPVALQRAKETCRECSLDGLASKLTGARDAEEDGTALLRKRPFHSGAMYRGGGLSVIGLTKDLDAFELIRRYDDDREEACHARVFKRLCGTIEAEVRSVGTDVDHAPVRLTEAALTSRRSRGETTVIDLSCVRPRGETLVCDEGATRVETLEAPEPLASLYCDWTVPSRPSCKLPRVSPAFDGGLHLGPIMRCTPEPGAQSTWFPLSRR